MPSSTIPSALPTKRQMVMSKRSQQKSTNSLLAALPEAEYQRLSPHLERVSTSKGEVLHASDAPAKFVHFLEKGVASLSVSTEEGKKMQLSIVGNESVVGERAILRISHQGEHSFHGKLNTCFTGR